MALALTARDELAVHVVHDERSAAFVALGLGSDGVPAALLCTSGTAAANFLPAVVEAGLSAVPMLVLTADRPPELRDVGAPQTIDQTHLFGRSVRWFHDPGVADDAASGTWRSLARRAFQAARTGPVHLNLPFREPLVGEPAELPPPLAADRGHDQRAVAGAGVSPPGSLDHLDHECGVILAGGRSGVPTAVVAALAKATQWPLLADPTSGMTHLGGAVTCADALLRDERFSDEHVPTVVVRIGRPPASRVVNEWISASGAPVVQVGGPGVIDPDHHVVASVPAADLAGLAAVWRGASGGSWADGWRDAADRAEAAIDELIAGVGALTEPAVARTIARHLPDGAELVVASSMPVRDLEWYGGPGARAHANRGANGIDGVVSTALGRALGGRPIVALVGDIAFVHDAGALTALTTRGVDLRIVIVDNDGGGIFSFLPQVGELPPASFEQLFGTPHGTNIVALAAAHGLDATSVTAADDLAARITSPGPSVTCVPTDRAANVAHHRSLTAAVAAAVA